MADYPLPTFHFQVSWGGAKLAFTEVTGLKVETQVIEYRDGLSPDFSPLKMPGLVKSSDITLKRGVFRGDNDLFKWWKSNTGSTAERRSIVISLLDEKHQAVVVWKVKNAWASSIDGPTLNSSSNEVAIESMTIVNEGIEVENG